MLSDRPTVSVSTLEGNDSKAGAPTALKLLRVIRSTLVIIALTFSPALAQRGAPATAQVYYKRGLELLDKQQTDRAIVEFKRAIALKPSYADAHNALGLALARKGEMN